VKKFTNICVLLLLVSLFISCSSENNKVVGTWASIEYIFAGEKSDRVVTATFNKDGTAQTGLGKGTYVIEGNTITFNSEKGVEIIFELQSDGNLKTENPATRIIYKKK